MWYTTYDNALVAGHTGFLALVATAGGQRVNVQAHSRQVVLGLADVHPVALQLHGVELFGVGHGREDLALDGSGAQLEGGW